MDKEKKQKSSIKLYSPKFFGLCGFAGIWSCGLTHAAVTPVDVVKCRMQTGAPYKGTIDGFRQILKADPKMILRGMAPTGIGYAFQVCEIKPFYRVFRDLQNLVCDNDEFFSLTLEKGGYELFKYLYLLRLCPEQYRKKTSVKTGIYMAASASAEFFADIALCPWEVRSLFFLAHQKQAVKVRLQTSAEGTFPTTMRKGLPAMINEIGVGGMFKGLVPLWTRQIPYTIIKFTTFERFVGMLYKHVFKSRKRHEYSKNEQLGVSFLGGYMAGVFCALVSHPADVVVSKVNKTPGATIMGVSRSLSFKQAWQGLGPRIFMIGTLTALQWYIYDFWKTYYNFPTSGGH